MTDPKPPGAPPPPTPDILDPMTAREVLAGGPPPQPYNPARPPALKFYYDADDDVLTIEGIRYHGEVFRQFGGGMPLNTPLKVASREDGVLVVLQMEPHDPDWRVPAEREVPDEDGFTWHYDRFDWGHWLGVCGRKAFPDDDQRGHQVRYAVRWRAQPVRSETPAIHVALADPDLLARAKAIIKKRIDEGHGIYGDACVEGREETIE